VPVGRYNRVVAQPHLADIQTPEKTVRDVDRRIIAIWCGRGRGRGRLPTKLNEMGVISSVLVYGVLWVRAWRWRWRTWV
jgi:hypothetical protein